MKKETTEFPAKLVKIGNSVGLLVPHNIIKFYKFKIGEYVGIKMKKW